MEDLNCSNQEFLSSKNLKAIRLKNQQKQNFKGGIIIAKELEEALKPTNDYIFKRIFGQKGNEEITKGLINSILDEKVENIDLSESPILEKDLKDDKENAKKMLELNISIEKIIEITGLSKDEIENLD